MKTSHIYNDQMQVEKTIHCWIALVEVFSKIGRLDSMLPETCSLSRLNDTWRYEQ